MFPSITKDRYATICRLEDPQQLPLGAHVTIMEGEADIVFLATAPNAFYRII